MSEENSALILQDTQSAFTQSTRSLSDARIGVAEDMQKLAWQFDKARIFPKEGIASDTFRQKILNNRDKILDAGNDPIACEQIIPVISGAMRTYDGVVDPEFVELGEAFFITNKEEIDKHASTFSRNGKYAILKAYRKLSEAATSLNKIDIKKQAEQGLIDNLSLLLSDEGEAYSLCQYIQEIYTSSLQESALYADRYLLSYYQHGSTEQKQHLEEVLERIAYGEDFSEELAFKKMHSLYENIFAMQGLSFDHLLQIWSQNALSRYSQPKTLGVPYKRYRGDNIKAIFALYASNREESIAAHLSQVCGIENYARYPLEILVRQYEQIKNPRQVEHAIAIYPKADPIGAYDEPELLTKYAHELRSWDAELFIVEINNEKDLEKKGAYLEAIAGEASFPLLIAGHCDGSTILVGNDSAQEHRLDAQSLTNYFVNSKSTSKKKIIILHACQANKQIAPKLRNAIDADILAADFTGHLTDIKLTRNQSMQLRAKATWRNLEVPQRTSVTYYSR